MKIFKLFALCALLALLLVPAAVVAQEQAPERGVVEFGVRGVTGEVYGRTDPGTVPFSNGFRPDLRNSALNTYQDYRNGFYIPKINYQVDSFLGSQSYLKIQSASNALNFEGGTTLSRDLGVLVTAGQYGHYKVQFRFDETPHVFDGTTRTLFGKGGRGVWTVDPTLRNSLFNTLCVGLNANGSCKQTLTGANLVALNANTISSAIAGTLAPNVSGAQLFTQQEARKKAGGLVSWNLTPDLNVLASFSREHQIGTRPIGFVMGASSGAYVAEAPEQIDYYTNDVRLTTEIGQKQWVAQLGYQGSFFQNNTPSMLVMNPFSNVDNQLVYSKSSSNLWSGSSTVGPASGRMDLYPDNKYQQFVGQGAIEIGKYIHLMANVTPGWMSQTQSFQPLTSNTYVTTPLAAAVPTISQTAPAGYPSFLPASNLGGKVSTLAMNYTGVLKARKDLVFTAKFQYYDYSNQTPDLLIRPVVGDTAFLASGSFHGSTAGCYDPVVGAAASLNVTNNNYIYYCPAEQSSFNSKLLDLGGTWFFTKKDSVKFGYQRGWMDRTNREVAETIEGSFYGALDMHLRKHLLLRVSGRHQNRLPQGGAEAYEADTSNLYARMPDQSTRVRNRGDASLQWDATQKLSLSAFFGTLQDNYNQRNSVNSLVPLGDATYSRLKIAGTAPTPIYGPYYAYGLLNNIGRNYGFDVNYALTPKVILFAEYAREKNTGAMVQGRGLNDPTCVPTGAGYIYPSGCDPINDMLTANKDVVNSYYGGTDITVSKKFDVSLYYSLSLAQSFVNSDGVNCQISNNPTSYCSSHFTNWSLDTAANPALTFSYPQNVNRVHEAGAIARFKLTQNLVPKFQYIFRQYGNNDWQTGVVNPLTYPGTTIDPMGNTALQKLLFLGADLPSYRAHVFTATLEYHF
jgi:hypothetical protein